MAASTSETTRPTTGRYTTMRDSTASSARCRAVTPETTPAPWTFTSTRTDVALCERLGFRETVPGAWAPATRE